MTKARVSSPGEHDRVAGPLAGEHDHGAVENASLFRDGSPIQAPRRKWVDIGERGLLASQNLRKREKLLFVPPSLVIAADSVRTNGEAGEVMKRFDVPDLPLLATCASIDDDAAAVADEGARLAVHGRIDANATEFQELLDSLKAICSPISLRVSKVYKIPKPKPKTTKNDNTLKE
ncbi:hypothetical protein Bca4012_037411 [Brassica carinata]